jgi:uncharacterized protein (DUF2236 family)
MKSDVQSFEATLSELARNCRDPRDGVFGPESTSWELGREAFLFVGAGRAALLQTAHPFVAHAIDQHSQTQTDPLGRFHRTFEAVYGIVFGDLEHAFRMARNVRHIHDGIQGLIREDVGRFRRGDAYLALDVEALLWVHATLIHTSIYMHELMTGPMPLAKKEAYYQESKAFARLFAVPNDALPPTWTAFEVYFDDAVNSSMISVGEPAKEIARFLFSSPRPAARVVMKWFHLITAGLLPEPVREGYGMRFSLADRALFQASLVALRNTLPRLPERLRFTPAYVEATRRIEGLPPVDPAGRRVEQMVLDFIQPAV